MNYKLLLSVPKQPPTPDSPELIELRAKHPSLCFDSRHSARLNHDFKYGRCRNCGEVLDLNQIKHT